MILHAECEIEYCMFGFIRMNWRGKLLISDGVIVNLIGSTTTRNGLMVSAELNTNRYEKGSRISDEELAAVNLKKSSLSRRMELFYRK